MYKRNLSYSILNKKIKTEVAVIIILYAVAIITSIEVYTIKNYLDKQLGDFNVPNVIDMSNFENSGQGITYYISAEGTSSEGTDINNPMSLETANSKTFKTNDRILLKCGDIFYGNINFNVKKVDNALLYIGNYGEGEMPRINGAKIINKKDAWEKLEEYEDVYAIDLTNTNNFEGIQSTDAASINIGFIEDANGNQYGNRKKSLELLDEEFSFYCDNQKLYIKSSDNPNVKLGEIKAPTRIDLVNLTGYTEIEGIKIQYTSAHGIAKKWYPISNVYIHNCIVENIGGSIESTSSFTRYGNAIEFWLGASNVQVENNIIRNVYDAGFTIQGSSEGWNNIIVKDNILIKNCYSFELWGSRDSTGMNNVQIYNNICINEGKGWGQNVRPNPYNSAEYVFYSYGENANMDINMYNNSYINTTRMYYVLYTTKERFKQNIKANNNKMYWSNNTMLVNSSSTLEENGFSYLYNEYNVEQDSKLHNVTDEQLEKINNEQILNSDDYNEIKTYYEDITNAIDASTQITELQNKYGTLQETYNSVIQSNINMKQKINLITTKLSSIETDSALSSTNIEELINLNYELGTIAISNKIPSLKELLIAINEIGNKYIEILKNISITNNNFIQVETDKIIELSNKIEQNKDLQNIELVKSIYQIISTDYNNYAENQDNLNIQLGRSIQIENLIDWSNKIIELDIEDYIENAKVEIKYSTTQLTNQDVTAMLNTNANIQITNNSNSKEHIFTQNDSFTFDYTIKGQEKHITATVTNIDKILPEITGVENDRLYLDTVNPKITDDNLQNVELYKNNNLIESYQLNTPIIEDGTYNLKATDRAGNEKSIKFYISRVPARIEISETKLTNKDVTATLVSDLEVKINNNEGKNTYIFKENNTFEFQYTIKGQDLTSNVVVNNIDKTSPKVTGVENKKVYLGKATPIVTDENLQDVKLYKNEELLPNYKLNTQILEEGIYKIIATDKATNKTEIEFAIMENTSKEYQIKDSYVLNIENNTSKSEFDKKINTATKYKIMRNEKEITNEEKIATGDKMITNTGEEYTLIVAGDISKDGDINIYDLNRLRICLLTGNINLDEEQKLAADCNLDGKEIGIMDLVRLRILILTKNVEN